MSVEAEMGRPVDWWMLGLDADPTPGCPERVESLARKLEELAGTAEHAGRALLLMRDDDTALAWSGLSRDLFGERFGDFPAQLRQVHAAHRTAAAALTAFAPRLRRAQADADRALGDARAVLRASAPAPAPVPPPAGPEPALDAARNLVEQARRLRDEAATECARAVDVASGAALRPRSFWDKLDDAFTMLWDVVHQPAKCAATVVAVVALLVGGPPVWPAMAAGAVLLIGASALFEVVFGLLDRMPGTHGRTAPGIGHHAAAGRPVSPAMRAHLRGLCPASVVVKDFEPAR